MRLLKAVPCLAAVAVAVFELVLANFAAQRVPMNAKHFSREALIAFRPLQRPLDEALLEFSQRFLKKNSSLHHLTH